MSHAVATEGDGVFGSTAAEVDWLLAAEVHGLTLGSTAAEMDLLLAVEMDRLALSSTAAAVVVDGVSSLLSVESGIVWRLNG